MSAEVAIIKNDCVVLAADSAVTIGNKHYNTACKLFQLAEPLPVGVMFFGSGTLCGVDLVTLLKLFRQQVAKTPLPRLKDYADAFVTFLQNNVAQLFPPLLQQRALKQDATSWTDYFLNSLTSHIDEFERVKFDTSKKLLTPVEVRHLAKDHVVSCLAILRKTPPCWNIKSSKWVTTHAKDQIVKSIEEYIGEVGFCRSGTELIEGQENLLVDMFAEDYAKNAQRQGSTGVVFAGYGVDDLFPTVLCVELDGISDGKVRFRYDDEKNFSVSDKLLSKDNPTLTVAEILSFAQAENMVDLYTRGIAIDFHCHIMETIENALIEAKLSTQKIKSINEKIEESIIDYSHENYGISLLGNIGLLPADETAQLAELLIKLTSFRQHVADEAEEVAEPIDVAMISKADGFVWYKRKSGLIKP